MYKGIFFIIFHTIVCLVGYSQVRLIDEGFSAGTTPPTGWTFTSIGSTYTTATNYGRSSPSLRMDATSDRIETSSITCPDSLSFWIKGQSTDASSSLLVEGFNGTTWTSITNIIPLPTTGTNYSYLVSTTYTKFRFTYTKSVGNLSIDDIVIRKGICSGDISPHITGVLINSCNGSCSEGDNEIIFLNSGSFPINVSPTNIVIKYESINPPTVTYTDAFTSNASYVSSLNTNSTCGSTVFYDAVTSGVIPSNSIFCIVKSTACYNYVFSDMCSVGNIYVLFTTDASWVSGGNFSNGGVGSRYFTSDFSNIVSGSQFTYSYSPGSLSGSDGDAIVFNYGGGAPSTYYNSGCTPSSLILPVELFSFGGYSIDSSTNYIEWVTLSEINNDHFSLVKSYDMIEWENVCVSLGSGNSNVKIVYGCYDNENKPCYYKLIQFDLDGESKSYNSIYVNKPNKITERYLVSILNIMGQETNGNINDGILIYHYSDNTYEKKIFLK